MHNPTATPGTASLPQSVDIAAVAPAARAEAAPPRGGPALPGSPSITNMIRFDHSHTMALFHRYKAHTVPRVKRGLAESICLALEIHAQLEEEIFYPALRAVTGPLPDADGSADDDAVVLAKSEPEHDSMRAHIARLRAMPTDDPAFDSVFLELMREVIHHVADEETVLLPEAERLLHDQLGALGWQMTKRRLQLVAPKAPAIAWNLARAVKGSTAALAGGVLAAAAAGLWWAVRRPAAGGGWQRQVLGRAVPRGFPRG